MALCINCRIGERIVIGEGAEQIVVELLDVRCGKAKLGFEADPKIRIHREELLPVREDTRHGPQA